MKKYRFTEEAGEDLIRIWRDTLKTWGENQADKYQDLLFGCVEKIITGTALIKKTEVQEVYRHHCEHHYIFFAEIESEFVIIAILHEKMDLPSRLRERLER